MPNHIVVDRDGMPAGESPEGFLEDDDWVSLHGVKIKKPFVEKPASGEDHNVYIYYPYSMVRDGRDGLYMLLYHMCN